MNTQATLPDIGRSSRLRADHRLTVFRVDLIGGGRVVELNPSLNFIRGDITTGKTTFVHLIRSMLATVPTGLPPEVSAVRAIQGTIRLRSRLWQVYRPLTTTRDAPIEIASLDGSTDSGDAIRLRATGAEGSYGGFVLDHLGLPAVSVPEGSTTTSRLNPVSMADWLGYCIITGDELDSSVFGHTNVFRDRKRRWIFQLVYGYYDADFLNLIALRRGVELRLDALDQESEIIQRFLERTPFADRVSLETLLNEKRAALLNLQIAQDHSAVAATGAPEIAGLRASVLDLRERVDVLHNNAYQLAAQELDLSDLQRQLVSQSAKLTRAIVSDELLVDFDFVVCPRCGTGVDSHKSPLGTCYLCHRPERPGTALDALLAEQDRVVSQISETRDVLESRARAQSAIRVEIDDLEAALIARSHELDNRTSAFISDHATSLQAQSRQKTRLETEIEKLVEYSTLLSRELDHATKKAELEDELQTLTIQVESKNLERAIADANLEALEIRMLQYLHALNIPQFAESVTVRINRTTFMPEVSERTFDELSSQGLKTLVNVAHALAHHTVAIDRDLPLPGLLVLDGLSANTGHGGLNQARVEDIYRLLISVSGLYGDSLQIIAVDNDIPRSIVDSVRGEIVLSLSQEDRLIRADLDHSLDDSAHPGE